MKVKVNRVLRGGRFYVNFEVSDFSTEELEKMRSFGVPQINMRWIEKNGITTAGSIGLTQISSAQNAAFPLEEQANAYQEDVLRQIKIAIRSLRERKDEFTSSEEVDI